MAVWSVPWSTPAIRKAMAAQSPVPPATATETSDGDLPSADSAALNSVPAPDRKLAPFMLIFWAVWPQIVLGSSASRSLASLGRLGRAKLGAPPDAVASDGAASDGA